MQRTLGGPLSSNDLNYLTKTINQLTNDGVYAVIDLHNYAMYNGTLIRYDTSGSGTVT